MTSGCASAAARKPLTREIGTVALGACIRDPVCVSSSGQRVQQYDEVALGTIGLTHLSQFSGKLRVLAEFGPQRADGLHDFECFSIFCRHRTSFNSAM